MPRFNSLATTAVLALSISSASCVRGPLAKLDPNTPIEVSGNAFQRRLRQNGQDLEPKSVVEGLSERSASKAQVRQAKVLQGVSLAASIAGGALIGWAIGDAAANDSDIDLKLVGAGGGLVGVGMCFAIGAGVRFNAAVTAHNRSFGVEP